VPEAGVVQLVVTVVVAAILLLVKLVYHLMMELGISFFASGALPQVVQE
jgi:hypothetical protein